MHKKLSHYTPRRRLGGEVQLLLILGLGSRWEWVVSVTPRPRFTSVERTPGTHCTGGWVGPRAGLDTEVRGKIICPCRGSNPGRPVVQPVVRHYSAWANPAPPQFRYLWYTPKTRGKTVKRNIWKLVNVHLNISQYVTYICLGLRQA
jgi:hypothetical protein